jgi:hypothetical protein
MNHYGVGAEYHARRTTVPIPSRGYLLTFDTFLLQRLLPARLGGASRGIGMSALGQANAAPTILASSARTTLARAK